MIEKIASIPGIRITTWKIGDSVYTFDQLEKLYYAIGAELLDVAVENGDFDMDTPDEYRKAKAITEGALPGAS